MLFTTKKKNSSFLVLLLSILILLVILLLVLSWLVFLVYKNQSKKDTVAVSEVQKTEINQNLLDLSNTDPEVGGVVEKVSRHILLPSKQFTVATVKDAAKLQQENPVLYQYLKDGQKVLLYDAGMIVYDEKIDKIVDVIQFYGVRQENLLKKSK